MKPIKLEMTAFGSYAETQPVDFRELGHNLYLITGDTGAGKTTIFDAVMFALYGVSGGAASKSNEKLSGKSGGKADDKSRTFEMMHCDYVEKSVKTVIRLEFEHMGKSHVVERTLSFAKNRTTGEFGDSKINATLWEADRDLPIDGSKKVTNRIKELLGMDAEQFCRIAMLAQGEFKRFLEADSEDKNKILGKLFDSSSYLYFQKLFDEARKRLKERRQEEGYGKIHRALEDFWRPEGLVEGDDVYLAGHSGLERALGDLLKKDGELKEHLENREKEYQRRQNELYEKSGAAAENHKKMDELAEREAQLESLLKQESDINRLEGQLDQVKKAFHAVKPKEDALNKARQTCRETEQKIEKLQQQLSEMEKDRAGKGEALRQCKDENETKIIRLKTEIEKIEQAIPKYSELEGALSDRERAQTEMRKSAEKKEQAGLKKNAAEQELKQLKDRRQELEGADANKVRLEGALEKAVKNLDLLTGKGGIREQVNGIHKKEADLAKEREKLKGLIKEAQDAELAYHKIYQAFITGQAGLLARNLEEELRENEEALCPVCRTRLHRSEHPAFAEFEEGTPAQVDVDCAKTSFETKDAERERQSEKITGLQTELETSKKNVVDRTKELMPDCAQWETLDAEQYLECVIEDCEREKKKRESDYGEARKQSEELMDLNKLKIPDKEKEIKEHEEALEICREEEREHKNRHDTLGAAIEELKRALEYPDKGAAEKEKRKRKSEEDERTRQLKEAQAAYDAAQAKCEKTRGELKSNLDNLPGFQADMERVDRLLEEALGQSGFKDAEEARKTLHAAGTVDSEIESWIASSAERVAAHKNNLNNTKARIGQLQEETEGLERIDLEELQKQMESVKRQQEEIREQLHICARQYDNHKTTADKVRDAKKMLKQTDAAWNRLDAIADLAAGTNAEGGKLSFDRYVMGYVFQEVLEMANRRLDVMSGGRYELIHERNAKRDNAKAGLEISVLDMATGKKRPSSSLSGGESFFVSLSLALGLSDVVQNHAGGKGLDALFIDEGFGALDGDVLDKALSVLNQLTEGNRLVGIISHVDKLKESIPQQICVKRGVRGSSVEIVK